MADGKPIILTEYPKSGGSWIVSLIGDVLQIPQRDIYVRPGFDLFDINKHPWYSYDTNLDFPKNSVIKSHELPNSNLIDFDADYIHLVRDGRDVIVSKWFFEKEFCVMNNISPFLHENFDNYVKKNACEWSNYINNWSVQPVVTIFYEDFLLAPVESLEKALNAIGYQDLSRKSLEITVFKFTKDRFSALLEKTFKHNTFVRKGISGDWRNYFSEKNVVDFKFAAGETLLSLGYELNSDWGI